MAWPVVDLHCDLLCYLEKEESRSPNDWDARCALPQLRQGDVKLQILALFTQTGHHSIQQGEAQVRLCRSLPLNYPKDVTFYTSAWTLDSPFIALLPAFENASVICSEEEPLKRGFERLAKWMCEIGKPLYISLTWNMENRFGGGAHTSIGLKDDGKRLLEELHQQQIAVDLSHTSDALAYEIIDYIEGQRLDIPLMASHSNVRALAQVSRNLPDTIIREIFRRKGIIGFNLIRDFLGETEDSIVKHVAHFFELGGENQLAIGADFFCDRDFPKHQRCWGDQVFYENFQDASCYGKLFAFLNRELKLNDSIWKKISHQNALSFIQQLY